jgi:drug/metabolite transporter (DMT)-like permease
MIKQGSRCTRSRSRAHPACGGLGIGLGQTLLALVPLATLLLAVAQGAERLGLGAVIGTLLALAGVAVISQGPLEASVPLGSLLAAVASAVCIAQAAVLVRRFPAVHPVSMNAVGMTTGAVLLVAGSVLAGALRPAQAPPTPDEVTPSR